MKKALIPILIFLGVAVWSLWPEQKPVPTGAGEVLVDGLSLDTTTAQKLSQEESLYSQIADDGTVIRTLVVEQQIIDSGVLGDPTKWVRSSNSGTIRKNGAGVGYKYDKTIDAFIPPKPTSTAVLNITTAQWDIPAEIVKASSTKPK